MAYIGATEKIWKRKFYNPKTYFKKFHFDPTEYYLIIYGKDKKSLIQEKLIKKTELVGRTKKP